MQIILVLTSQHPGWGNRSDHCIFSQKRKPLVKRRKRHGGESTAMPDFEPTLAEGMPSLGKETLERPSQVESCAIRGSTQQKSPIYIDTLR